MSKNICFKIKDILLYTEQILVFFDIPIFFICSGSNSMRYAVLCTDSEKGTYIIIEAKSQDILDMLQHKIKMIDLFYKQPTCYFLQTGDDYSSDIVKEMSSKDLSKTDLPKDDAYFELETPEILNYIIHLAGEMSLFNSQTIEREISSLLIKLAATHSVIEHQNFTNPIEKYKSTRSTYLDFKIFKKHQTNCRSRVMI